MITLDTSKMQTLDPPNRWIFPRAKGKNRQSALLEIAIRLKEIQAQTNFRVSVRGWCYRLEGMNIINKGEFDRCAEILDEVYKKGLLDIDFFLRDKSRAMDGLEDPDALSPVRHFQDVLRKLVKGNYYHPDYWKDERYFLAVIVEKIDLVSLFRPICRKYHIPIANSKGWNATSSRVDVALRFKEAADKGSIPVLLYCGDFDPWGLKISDTIRKNFMEDIHKITDWTPTNDEFVIDRFGLNLDFIERNGLTWIDNLISSSNKDLYKDGYLAPLSVGQKPNPIVTEYLTKYCTSPDGTINPRKCEANALVGQPELGRRLFEETVLKYLGPDAEERMASKNTAGEDIDAWLTNMGVTSAINTMLDSEE